MDDHDVCDPGLLDHARRLAERAARRGGDVALGHFRDAALRVETKNDGSFVSVADRAAEDAVREVLAADAELGACGVLGEERGATSTGSALRWVIDPIDGTFLFVNGIPLWGTLVALEHVATDASLVGVVHLPAIGACYTAARGRGATRDGVPIVVPRAVDVARAVVHVPSDRAFARHGLGDGLAEIRRTFPYTRGYFDCFGHAMAAEGAFAACVEFGLGRWDIAASRVLVEEAGGDVRIRPREGGRCDALLGVPDVVARLADILDFRTAAEGGGFPTEA